MWFIIVCVLALLLILGLKSALRWCGPGPKVGITGAETYHGQLGVWSFWRKKQNPLLRLRLEFVGQWGKGVPKPMEYVFVPVEEAPFYQQVALSSEWIELLVGPERAESGEVRFHFTFFDKSTSTQTLSLKDVLWLYRNKGAKLGSQFHRLATTRRMAPADLVQLDHEALIQKGEEIRKAEEEARLAAEQKAKEEAERLAAEKAAAEGGAVKTLVGAAEIEPTKVGLVYGSSTGNTADIAGMIRAAFGEDSFLVKNVTEIKADLFTQFDYIILGVPTWHIGEMQDDWAEFLPKLDSGKLKLNGKKIAIFGLGDGKDYADTYVDAMKELWDHFEPSGAELVGLWPTEGYVYNKSIAIKDGKFMGLVIDIENQNDKSEGRVKAWVKQIRSEFGI